MFIGGGETRMVRISLLVTLCLILSGTASQAVAQMAFVANPKTISGVVQRSATVVVAKWISARKRIGEKRGRTVFEITEVWKQSKRKGLRTFTPGRQVTIQSFKQGKKGDQHILYRYYAYPGWQHHLKLTNAFKKYYALTPKPNVPIQNRIAHYMTYLESADQDIASDAFGELASVPFKQYMAIQKQLPLKKIRKLLSSKNTSPNQLGLFGRLLGLCGDAKDAAMMEKKIIQQPKEFRVGIEGVMVGYLLLEGQKGLQVLEDAKFKNEKSSFSETYAAMLALRFMWDHAPTKIPKDRLRSSMRVLLNYSDRHEMTDLVIADLTKLEDWSIQDRLMKMYDEKEFDFPAVKRAIVRYLLTCSRSHDDKKGNQPKLVEKARTNLELLRKKDPKTVKNTERFYFLK